MPRRDRKGVGDSEFAELLEKRIVRNFGVPLRDALFLATAFIGLAFMAISGTRARDFGRLSRQEMLEWLTAAVEEFFHENDSPRCFSHPSNYSS